MMRARCVVGVLLVHTLAGCAVAEGGSAPASAPEPLVEEVAPEAPLPVPPPAEPEVPLQERWSAPFAVRSSGELTPRVERPAAVHLRPEAPAPQAEKPVEVAKAEEKPAEKPAAPTPAQTHRVERGDTLFGIARRYGVKADEIRAANRMESDVVKIGQTLVIPPSGR